MMSRTPSKPPAREPARNPRANPSSHPSQYGVAPIQPIIPARTQASPGASEKALGAILRRAERLTAGVLNKDNAPTIQRKATKLTPLATMQSGVGDTLEGEYAMVVKHLKVYLDDDNVPETNYGFRLRTLDVIRTAIREWEAKEGPLNQPVSSGIAETLSDRRRTLLRQLQETIGIEEKQVQDDGLATWKVAHAADREKLKEYLEEAAKSSERTLKNSAEWLMTGKATLFAVTPTGDSEARVEKAGMSVHEAEAFTPNTERAGAGNINAPPVAYNERNLIDNRNVLLSDSGKNSDGWNNPGYVAVASAATRDKSSVFETLRHEVQHDADWHRGRDAGAGLHSAGKQFDASGASLIPTETGGYELDGTDDEMDAGEDALQTQQGEMALTNYKTEYRAYSYEGGSSGGAYSRLDNSLRNQEHDGKMFTERQLAIFKHIYAEYPYTKEHWDADSPLTGGRTFRDEVANYWNPDTEGFNKYNSPMVDHFYRLLDMIGVKEAATSLQPYNYERDVAPVEPGTKISDPQMQLVEILLLVIDDMSLEDAEYIFTESPAMIRKLGTHLAGDALAAVMSQLQEKVELLGLGNISLFE